MNLVIRKDMTVDSRTIAAGCGIHHQTVIRIISENLGMLGCRLHIRRRLGKSAEFRAILTEDQVRTLLGLFRATPRVAAFSAHLAAAFTLARADQGGIEPEATPDTNERAALVAAKDMLTDAARLLQIAAHLELRLIKL